MGTRRSASPVLAGFLSAVLPGLGQFYNRQWGKGAGFLIALLLIAATLASSYDPQEIQQAALRGTQSSNMEVLLSLAMLLLGLVVWSIVDAARTAQGPR